MIHNMFRNIRIMDFYNYDNLNIISYHPNITIILNRTLIITPFSLKHEVHLLSIQAYVPADDSPQFSFVNYEASAASSHLVLDHLQAVALVGTNEGTKVHKLAFVKSAHVLLIHLFSL